MQQRECTRQQRAARSALRIVEGDDEITRSRSPDTPHDRLLASHDIGKGDSAKVVSQRRAQPCRQRMHGRNAAGLSHPHGNVAARFFGKNLPHQRSQTIDARIARAQQHRPFARTRQVEREARAFLLAADGRATKFGTRLPSFQQIDITFVAHDTIGFAQGTRSGKRAFVRSPGTQAY